MTSATQPLDQTRQSNILSNRPSSNSTTLTYSNRYKLNPAARVSGLDALLCQFHLAKHEDLFHKAEVGSALGFVELNGNIGKNLQTGSNHFSVQNEVRTMTPLEVVASLSVHFGPAWAVHFLSKPSKCKPQLIFHKGHT